MLTARVCNKTMIFGDRNTQSSSAVTLSSISGLLTFSVLRFKIDFDLYSGENFYPLPLGSSDAPQACCSDTKISVQTKRVYTLHKFITHTTLICNKLVRCSRRQNKYRTINTYRDAQLWGQLLLTHKKDFSSKYSKLPFILAILNYWTFLYW